MGRSFVVLVFNMLPTSKGFVIKITYQINSYIIHFFLALVGCCLIEILWIHKLQLQLILPLILPSKATIKRDLSLDFILRKKERKMDRKRNRDRERKRLKVGMVL